MGKKYFKSSKLGNVLAIYDLETSGKCPYTTEPIEICCFCADINTLEIKTDMEGNELIFSTLVKPTDWSIVEDKALQKNKITREQLMADDVPTQEMAFGQFCKFLSQFTKNNSMWEAPFACGYNICNFDNIIIDRLCYKYNYLDTKSSEPKLFHPIHNFDVLAILRNWMHNNDEMGGYSLDDVRDYFGISAEGAHRADKDCKDTWMLLKRFLTMYRLMAPARVKQFKGYFSNVNSNS